MLSTCSCSTLSAWRPGTPPPPPPPPRAPPPPPPHQGTRPHPRQGPGCVLGRRARAGPHLLSAQSAAAPPTSDSLSQAASSDSRGGVPSVPSALSPPSTGLLGGLELSVWIWRREDVHFTALSFVSAVCAVCVPSVPSSVLLQHSEQRVKFPQL